MLRTFKNSASQNYSSARRRALIRLTDCLFTVCLGGLYHLVDSHLVDSHGHRDSYGHRGPACPMNHDRYEIDHWNANSFAKLSSWTTIDDQNFVLESDVDDVEQNQVNLCHALELFHRNRPIRLVYLKLALEVEPLPESLLTGVLKNWLEILLVRNFHHECHELEYHR